MKIADRLKEKHYCKNIAVVDGTVQLTYQDLYKKASTLSQVLAFVSNRREHVAILLPNSANYVTAYCSVLLAGDVVVPIYFKATGEEIKNSVEYCDTNILITDTENFDRVENAAFDHQVVVINIDTLSMIGLGKCGIRATPQSPPHVAVMLGTSGSTSTPKRVMLSDENLIENAVGIIHSLQYTQDERFLCLLPMTFASGNTSQLIVSLLLTSTMYIYHGPLHPKFIFDCIKCNHITTITIVPSVLKVLLSDGKDYSSECPSLKTICFGGGPTDDLTISKIVNSPMRDKFVQMYGQTEASTRISHLHYSKDHDKPTSAGKPLFNVQVAVKRKDNVESENDLAPGEILVKGPNVMVGYYKETSSPIINGWLATGDVGYIAPGNYIYITGRKKNIIICSGMNIQAEEVENILLQHPGVSEALVFGIDDFAHGELPCAEVVLKQKATVGEKELKAFCAQHLSDYKIPAHIKFVEKLERTYNGKIARKKETKHE